MRTQAKFWNVIDSPWTRVAPVPVGHVPTGLGEPNVYVTAERGEERLRIDVYAWPAGFQEAIAWADLVVVGFGDAVHFVSWSGVAKTVPLTVYFGHIYPLDDQLLVADAQHLYCFDRDANRRWQSDCVGLDGVVVKGVADGVITGEGQWDPPNGWRPFRIALATGRPT